MRWSWLEGRHIVKSLCHMLSEMFFGIVTDAVLYAGFGRGQCTSFGITGWKRRIRERFIRDEFIFQGEDEFLQGIRGFFVPFSFYFL